MGLRDIMSKYLPSWLGDNYPASPSYGFRWLWTCGLFVDAAIEVVLQGSLSAVGKGTPSALAYVGQARGVTRSRIDTDESYAAKLPSWIDRWKTAGSARRLALEIWEYLGDARVRIVTRSGHWVDVAVNGTITEYDAAWNWDSVSHPERASYWSEIWVIVCPAWAHRPGTLGDLTGADGFSLGQLAPTREIDTVKRLLMTWKSAHTMVRAVIWTSDPTRFDPLTPASMPDGTWGAWSINVGGSQVASGRDLTTCRYWEPR